MKVATIPIGYADGISKSLGNEKGLLPSIIKSYDFRFDLYGHDDGGCYQHFCKTGDEVIVFGKPESNGDGKCYWNDSL